MARKPYFEPGRRPSGHHIPVKKAIRAFRGRGHGIRGTAESRPPADLKECSWMHDAVGRGALDAALFRL
jgi:hypothetical protein